MSLAARSWVDVLKTLGPFDGPAEEARLLWSSWDERPWSGFGPALLYACFVRDLAEALYRPVLGDETWEWVTSGRFAPTVHLVRQWLANDTWELLGGPVPVNRMGSAASVS